MFFFGIPELVSILRPPARLVSLSSGFSSLVSLVVSCADEVGFVAVSLPSPSFDAAARTRLGTRSLEANGLRVAAETATSGRWTLGALEIIFFCRSDRVCSCVRPRGSPRRAI